eukprot:scaffold2.g6869.t1
MGFSAWTTRAQLPPSGAADAQPHRSRQLERLLAAAPAGGVGGGPQRAAAAAAPLTKRANGGAATQLDAAQLNGGAAARAPALPREGAPLAGPGPAAGPAAGGGRAGSRGGAGSGSGAEFWQELLQTPDPDTFGPRMRSASDAAVLRRKGHLKEQDQFIDFVLAMHQTHTSLEVMQKLERWIAEHRKEPRQSRLRRLVPLLGSFFTPLRLVDAFLEYDEFFALSRRQYVPPNFAEIRHILNIAQVHSSARGLRLITFDADGTLYADGAHMEHDNQVRACMRAGMGAFHIMGGECNYLLCVDHPTKRLRFVPDARWKSPTMAAWGAADIEALLSEAEVLLLEGAARLRLPVEVLRKERAVGVLPQAPTIYEVLEELAIAVQNQLVSPLPFCAFNGGNDVFVDVGNKSLGLEALMNYLGFTPAEARAFFLFASEPVVLHVGDRFTASGNDSATRDCCSILWVANPEETDWFVRLLLRDIELSRHSKYIE